MPLTLAALAEAAALIRPAVPPTPQLVWPLLNEASGAELWVKHENHTRLGAFKIRGGLTYVESLCRRGGAGQGLITATRGNHGQSIAAAAGHFGLPVSIVVPRGNGVEKNQAMRALGADLIVHGDDFDAARDFARAQATARGLHMVPSFHPDLVRGVATAALEFLTAAPPLHAVYVPIGLGSGICAMIAVRDLLGLPTRIIGVVAARADAYARSMEAGRPVSTATADTIADGIACRVPDPSALAQIRAGADRILRVSEAQIRAAIRLYARATHNLAEGAAAAALAAIIGDRNRIAGQRIGIVHTGGNIDTALLATILAEPDEV